MAHENLRKRIEEVEKFRPLYIDLPLEDAKALMFDNERLREHLSAAGINLETAAHTLRTWDDGEADAIQKMADQVLTALKE